MIHCSMGNPTPLDFSSPASYGRVLQPYPAISISLHPPLHSQTGFQVLGAFVMVGVAVPVVLPVFVPLGVAFYLLRVRYVRTSREVKRWEAVTRCEDGGR